jgi:hypothetical protein
MPSKPAFVIYYPHFSILARLLPRPFDIEIFTSIAAWRRFRHFASPDISALDDSSLAIIMLDDYGQLHYAPAHHRGLKLLRLLEHNGGETDRHFPPSLPIFYQKLPEEPRTVISRACLTSSLSKMPLRKIRNYASTNSQR